MEAEKQRIVDEINQNGSDLLTVPGVVGCDATTHEGRWVLQIFHTNQLQKEDRDSIRLKTQAPIIFTLSGGISAFN